MKQHEKLISSVFNCACEILGIDADSVNIGLTFVDTCEITALNMAHRNKGKVTDVLSFPLLEITAGQIPSRDDFLLDINPATGRVELGDIIICEQVAREQAESYGHSLNREIAFLYVHAMLHLVGYTHEDELNEKKMNELTEKILQTAGVTR
ncbi:MAG: rRNA maturation RNase YbeY [Firmicutes bacterium]|nr:rRNA maturation RNase YbeY [Bacillota bacterium]